MVVSVQRSLRPWVLVVAVVLLSSAGLLVTGLVSLWRSVRAAEVAAAAASERTAGLAARALRASLRDPAQVTSRAGSGRAFRIVDGRLALPAGFPSLPWLPWLIVPPPEDPELELPIALLSQVRAAEASERASEASEGDADGAAATNAFAAALAAAQSLPRKQSRWVELAAAWSAQRRGDTSERDARLAPLIDGAEFTGGGDYRSVVAGTLLLALEAGRALPIDVWRAALAALESETRDALLAEVDSADESTRARVDLAAVRAVAQAIATQRRVLTAVAPHATRLARAREPLLEAVGDDVLIYFPAPFSDAGASEGAAGGDGALVPPRELVGAMPEAGAFTFVFGSAAPSDAIPVAPQISIVPAAPRNEGGFAGTRGLAALLVVLATTFGVGLFVASRMVRREVELTVARARFLTNVTHELKTPLASIRLFSEMLLEGRVESEAKRDEYHRLLAGESERLSALIENVLDLGRLERGERALDLQPRRIDELAREVVERFAPLAARDGLAITTCGFELPCEASCDRGALAQALVNLLDNARKYAAGGSRVELALERAEESSNATARVVRLHVRDFGPGIAEEERTRIFEPFVRGERQRDGSVPGLGLGLHLARTLLRAQGGDLTCSAADGGGARFTLELPIRATTSATSPTPTMSATVRTISNGDSK